MKTGFTCPAGFNLVASATRDGRRLVAVVMGTRNGNARALMAKVLLQAGFGLRGRARLAEFANVAGKPPNLRGTVCAGTGLTIAGAGQLGGWGASLGRFKAASDAEAVVKGTRVARAPLFKGAGAGVVRVPFTKEYVALMWNSTEQATGLLCDAVKASGSQCEIVSPAVFQEFANLAAREQGGAAAPAAAPVAPAAAAQPAAKPAQRQKRATAGSDR